MSDYSERIRRLTPAQRELLLHRLSQSARSGMNGSIPCAESAADYPLSFAQQRLWFLEQLSDISSAYHISLSLDLRGPLVASALARSFQALVDRHDILRTSFVIVGNLPRQRIAPELRFELPIVDLTVRGENHQEVQLSSACQSLWASRFSLDDGPLLRARLFRWMPEQYLLTLVVHHLVADGWSLGIVLDELAAFYSADVLGIAPQIAPLPLRYVDFAAWQQSRWNRGELRHELDYWSQQLRGLAPLDLPSDRPRPGQLTFRGATESLSLSLAAKGRIVEWCRAEQVTLFTALLANFHVLLSQFSGQSDVAVGTPIAGRVRPELESLVGCFINLLVLRAEVRTGSTYREFLQRTRDDVWEAFAHQELPFEKLVETLRPARTPARHPLVQVLFAVQNAPMHVREMPGLELTCRDTPVHSSRFDLEWNVWETGNGIHFIATYNPDLFDKTTIVQMLQHYRTLIESTMHDSSQRISALPSIRALETPPALQTWQWSTRKLLASSGDTHAGSSNANSNSNSHAEPATPLEVQIAAVWSAMLGCSLVGRNDDFFALGGDSMLAARMVRWLGETLQLPLDVRAVFEHRELQRFAAYVDTIRWSRRAESERAADEELEF